MYLCLNIGYEAIVRALEEDDNYMYIAKALLVGFDKSLLNKAKPFSTFFEEFFKESLFQGFIKALFSFIKQNEKDNFTRKIKRILGNVAIDGLEEIANEFISKGFDASLLN